LHIRHSGPGVPDQRRNLLNSFRLTALGAVAAGDAGIDPNQLLIGPNRLETTAQPNDSIVSTPALFVNINAWLAAKVRQSAASTI
jgi:hypothetical protein